MAALSSGPSWLSPGMVGLSLLLLVHLTYAAPVQESQQTEIDSYFGESTGCYYNYESYHEGDRIITNEPCLNCTCHNRMLMCYLRVCPYTKPIGQDCTVEKREDQCCPVITCPEVPVELLTSTTTASSYETTDVGHLDNYGCSIENKFYSDGAQVPSNPKKPCELCYCIRNMTACVMQECTLHVEGCRPIYQKGVCCPVRYDCDRDNEETLLLDPTTTTERPTPGFLLTTTQQPGAATDCTYENDVYADGALITTVKPCEHCYCMRGDIVCAVQECGTPLENEGKNCTAVPPKHDQCCPDTYECDNATILSITTDVIDSTTLSSGSDSNVDTSIEESAAQTPLKLDVPSTDAEHEQVVKKEDELPSVDSQSTVKLDEHDIESSSVSDIEESIVPTVVAITKSPEEEVIETASEETTLETESSGEKESDINQEPEEDVQQQVNPHIIDDDILEESKPVHPTHPGFIFEHDAKPTTERSIIEEEILVNKDELKPVIDHTLAPVDADNEIHFTDQHEGSGHHIVSDNQVIEEVVSITEKQSTEEEQPHEEVSAIEQQSVPPQTSVSSPEPVVVDEDEDTVSSSGDGSSTATELEQKPVRIDDEQEHINPIIDHVKDVIGQTIQDTDSIDEQNNLLPTEHSISAPSENEPTDVDVGQITITNKTPIDVNKDEEIIHEIDSTEESQQSVTEDNKQDVENQSIAPVDEVPLVIEADEVKNIITPEDTTLEPSSHIDTKISEQSVTESEASAIDQNIEEVPEKVTDDNKIIGDSDITTIVSIDKHETEQNEDEIIEEQTVIKADLPTEGTDADNIPEQEEVSVSEKIVPIVTSQESTQVQTDDAQSITEDSAIISETPLVEEVVTVKSETPLTEEVVTDKSETSLTDEAVTVKSEAPSTEEAVTVKSDTEETHATGLTEQESTDSETGQKPIDEVHATKQESDIDQQIIEAVKPSEPSLEQEHITESFVETQKIDELGESHTQEEFQPTTSAVEEQKQENHPDESQELPASSADEHLPTDQKLQNSDSTTSQPEIAHSDDKIETTSSSIITPTENINIESEQPSQSSDDLPVEENVDTKPLKSDKDDELVSVTPFESEDKPIQSQESEPTAQAPVQIETDEPIVYEKPVELTTLPSATLVEGDTINADDKHDFQVPEVVSTMVTEVSSEQTEIPVDNETKKDDNNESTSSETIQTDVAGETENKPENIPTVVQSETEIADTQEIEPTKSILNKPDETYGDVQTTETSNESEITSQEIDKRPTDDEQTVQKEHEEYIPLIPGEGDCLVDGVTYLNNTSIATVNRCQISCMCISSVIRCESVDCSPPPPNMFRCQPVYHGPDCCPTYMCEGTEAATLESDSHISESYPDALTPTEITLDIGGTDIQGQSSSTLAPIEAVESPHSPVEDVQKVHVDASVKPPLVKSEESEGPIYRPDIQQVGETDHVSTVQQSASESTSEADDQTKGSDKPTDSIEIDAEKPFVPELPSSVTPQLVDHSDERIESSTGNAVEHPVPNAGSDGLPEEDVQTHVVPNIDSDLIVKPVLVESDSQSSESDQHHILELETLSPDVSLVTEATKGNNEAANELNQDDLQIPHQSVDLIEDNDKTTELSNKPDQETVPVTSDVSDEYETSSDTATVLKDTVEGIQEHDSQKPIDESILEHDINTPQPVLNENEDSHTDSNIKDNSQTEEHSIDTPSSIDSVIKPDVEQTVPEGAAESQTTISSMPDLPIEPVVELDNVDTVQQALIPEDGLATVPSDVTPEAETPVIASEESNEPTTHVETPSSSEQDQQSENDESQKTDDSQLSIGSTDQAPTLAPENTSQQQQTDISESSTSSENDVKQKPDDLETSAVSQEQNPTDAPQEILSTETQVSVKPEGDEKVDISTEHSGNQDTEAKPEDTNSQSTIVLDDKEILPTTESDDSQKVELPEEVKADKETSTMLESEGQTHLPETQTGVTPTDEILQVPEKPIDNLNEDTVSKPEETATASNVEPEEVKADKETNIVLESDAQTGVSETETSLTPTDEILQVPEKPIDNINEDTSLKPEETEAASHDITEVQISENTDNADDLKTSIKPEKDDSPLTQAPVTAVESEDQGQVAVKPEEDLSIPSVLEESGSDSQSASQPEFDKPALHEDDKEVEVSINIQPTTDSINSVDSENEVDEKPKLPLDEILQTPETAVDDKINHESEKPALESSDKNILSSETQQPITPTVQSELPATGEDSQKQEPILPPVDSEIEIQTSAPQIIEIVKPDEISSAPIGDSQVIEADKPVASVDQNEDTTVSVPSDSSTTSELDENLTVTPVKLDDGSEISTDSETTKEPVTSSDVKEITIDSTPQEPISGITDDSKTPAELPSITESEISAEKDDSQLPELESEQAVTDSPIKYNSIDSVDLQTPVDTDKEDEQKPAPELHQPVEDVIKPEVDSTITTSSQPEKSEEIEPSVESQRPVEIDNSVILPEETQEQTKEPVASVPQVDVSAEVESEKESTGSPLDTELPSQPISQTDATTILVEEDQSSVNKDDTSSATSRPTEVQTEVSVQTSETVVPETHSQDTNLESTENTDKLDDNSTPSYEVSEDVQSQQKPLHPVESEENSENPIEVTIDTEHVQSSEISTNAPLESDSQTLIKDVPTIIESDNVDQVVSEVDSAVIQETLTESDSSSKPDHTSEVEESFVESTSVSYDVQTEVSVKVNTKPELSENTDELLPQTNIQTESDGSSESPIELQTVSIKEDPAVIPDKDSQPELPATYEGLPEDDKAEQTTDILKEDLNKNPTQTSSDDTKTETELTTQQSIVTITDRDEIKLVSDTETELSSASESSKPEISDVIEHNDKISESDKIDETLSPETNEESTENSHNSIAPVQIDAQPEVDGVDNDSSQITSTPEISSDVDSTDQSIQEGVQQAIPMESDSHLANIPNLLEDDKQSHISSELDVHTDSSVPDVTESVIISHINENDGKPITPEQDNNLDSQISVTGVPILEGEKLPEVQVTENVPVKTSETTSTKIAEPVAENDKHEVQLPEVEEDNEIPEKDVILETKPVQPQVQVLPELIEDNEDAIGQVTEGQVNIKPTDNVETHIINTDAPSQINLDSEINETEDGNVQVTQTGLDKPAELDITEDQVIDSQVQVTEGAQVAELPTESILLENNDKEQAVEENVSLTDSSSVASVDAGEGAPVSDISVLLSGHNDDETIKPETHFTETVTEEEKVEVEGDLTSEQAPTSVPHIEESVQEVEDVVSTSNDSSSAPQVPETFEHLPESQVSNESAHEQLPESNVSNESTHGELPESHVSNESSHGELPESNVSNESEHGQLPESHVSNESAHGQLPDSHVSNESSHGELPESNVSNESSYGQLPESQVSNESHVSNESAHGQLPESHVSNESSYGHLPESHVSGGSSYGQLPHDYESHEKPSSSKPTESHSPSSHTDDNAYENSFPSGSYGQAAEEDYEEDDQTPFGPGTCRYGGKVYVSAQQIPRDDPCDFCFCFRSDIICLQQSCPPPIPGCHEEPIQGFCCPRYECHVSMATMLNVTTTTTTSTTTLPPHFLSHAYHGAATRRGCQINGQAYQVGEVVRSASGPCLHCTCGGDGQMKCDPKVCSPEPMLRQMIAAAAASRRRR